MNQFADFIKQIRISKNLTVNELAELSGISGAQVSRIENGKRNVPKPDTIRALSAALDIPYETLMRKADYISETNLTDKEVAVLNRLNEYPDLIDILLNLEDDKIKSLINLFS